MNSLEGKKKTCLCRKVGEFKTDAPHLRDSLKLIFFAKETPKKHIAYWMILIWNWFSVE